MELADGRYIYDIGHILGKVPVGITVDLVKYGYELVFDGKFWGFQKIAGSPQEVETVQEDDNKPPFK